MLRKILTRVAGKLNKIKIPYMVIGGQATLIYGEPRLTKDIDITLGIDLKGFDKIKMIIQNLNLKVPLKDPFKFTKKTYVLPAIDEKTGIRVDFIFSFSYYEKQAIEKGKWIKIGNTNVKFASLEDVVIHKIIAGRPRDIEDIRGILLKNRNYDKKYIEKWLKEFDRSLNRKYLKVFKKTIKELNKK